MSDIIKDYQTFAVEQEATAGTAETIVAADVLNCQEGSSITKNPNMAPRNVIRDDVQKLAPKVGGHSCGVNIIAELKGSGTAGTTNNPLDDLLGACGIAMTADAGYAVRGVLDADLSTHEPITAKWFVDGKYITAAGVCGNATFTINAGETGKINFEGMGVLAAEGDGSALAAASDSPEPPVFINGDTWFCEHHSTTEDDLDGDGALLRGTAGYGEKLSKTIVQGSTTQKVMGVGVWLKKIGTPANETNGMRVEIQADAAGDPDGSAETNGTTGYLLTTAISDTDWEYYVFEFGSHGSRPTLTATATYHFVLVGDWDQADANCISVETDVVAAGAQNGQEYDGAAWNAMSLENISMHIFVAPEVENYFDGVEINLNNETSLVKDPNATQGWRYAKIRGRGDGVKATLAPLEKLDSEQDFWTELTAATDCFFMATLGDTSGNIMRFIFKHCKVSNAGTWEDREKEITHPIELHLRNTTDFELVMT